MPNVGDAAHSDGDVMRRLRELEGLVRELIAGRRLENAAIGQGGVRVKDGGNILIEGGGGLTVDDGGSIVARHEDGFTALLFGVHRAVDGGHVQGRGLLVQADGDRGGVDILRGRQDVDGTTRVVLGENGNPLDVFSAWVDETIIRDSEGDRLIFSDPGGVGLRNPWIPVAMYPQFVTATELDETGKHVAAWGIDSGELTGEEVLWIGDAPMTHPAVQVNGQFGAQSGDVAVTYRLTVGGTVVGSWSTSGAVATAEHGPFDITSQLAQWRNGWGRVQITAEVTSGTGQLACQVYGVLLRGT